MSLDRWIAGLDCPMLVVTATADGERDGCLVGFATQASIDPGRLLVCLSQANRTYRVALRAAVLGVHVLEPDQHALAALFGTQTGDEVDKLARCAWHDGPHGAPLLDDCPRWLVGRVLARHPLGDHDGFLLEPVAIGPAHPRPPLMFSAVKDLEAGHSA